MSDDDYRLEKRLEKIRESDLPEGDKEFLLNDYLNYQKRAGAEKQSTQERYLRRLKKILEQKDISMAEVKEMADDELKQFNHDFVDEIQDSYFKKNSGDLSKRNKRGYWNVWKRALETLGKSTEKRKDYIPNKVQFSTDRSKVQGRVNTSPQDLPTPRQMKTFLRKMKEISQLTGLRNQALLMLIWDTGARAEEALTIQMKHVSVQQDRLKVKIRGNKRSSDRRVEIFQGRKLLVDYIQQHPKKNDPEAYLFPPSKNNQHHDETSRFYTFSSRAPIRRKIHQARRKAELDFKTENEPFHIFRKAMTTFYVVNEVLSWEQVCERQGKSPEMPTYLKMAMQDIDSSAAEGFGLDKEKREMEHRMKAPALLPRKCRECGKENKCINEVCQDCGKELPESEMPSGEAFTEEEQDKTEEIGQIKGLIKALNASGVDIDQKEVEKYL